LLIRCHDRNYCLEPTEVFLIKIDSEKKANEVDVLHIQDVEKKHAITRLIENYKPNNTVDTEIKMKLILKDKER
jgi:hypothetical protein